MPFKRVGKIKNWARENFMELNSAKCTLVRAIPYMSIDFEMNLLRTAMWTMTREF